MTTSAPWRVALCAGGFSACTALAPRTAVLALVAAVLTCAAITVACADWRVVTVCVALVACLLGSWRGVSAAAVDSGPGSVAGHLGSGDVVLRGTVADAGVPGRDDTVVVDVQHLATQTGTWSVSGAVVAEPRTPVSLLPGDTVDVETTSLRAPPQRPGSLSAVALERVGVVAIASAAQVTFLAEGGPTPSRIAAQLRRTLSATVARSLPEPEAALLLGITFGIHGRLTAAVRTPLQNAGLIHVVAVSGLKVVMVAGLIEALARARGWPRRRRTVATLAVIALYVVLSGAGAAALRSSIMVGAGLLLSRDGRRPHSFALLAGCAALLLMAEPPVAMDVGFQLSFLGTAGILLLASPVAAHLPGPRVLVEPFAVTIAAQLATAPVIAGTFGVLSLVGPLANALALPLLPLDIVMGGAGALAGTAIPALGWLPLEVAGLVSRVVLATAQGMSALPLAAVPVKMWPSQWTLVEVVAVGAGASTWHLRTRGDGVDGGALVAALAVALVAGAASTWVSASANGGELHVTVLDVGNGAAVLIQPPGGGAVLVDGGSDGAALLTALGRVLSPLDRHLDAVVLTATDRATSAAIPSLIGHYDVGSVVVSQPLPPALQTAVASLAGTGTRVVAVRTAPWTLGGVRVRCIPSGPAESAPCVLQLSDGRATALITGNLASVVQDEVASVQASQLRCDLLIGPTTTAPSSALLAAARPRLLAVPAQRTPPGLGATGLDVAVSGRDSDLEYDALAAGGFVSATG